MDKMIIYHRHDVKKYIKSTLELFDVVDISDTDIFMTTTELDSLNYIEIIINIENKYNIIITDDDLSKMISIKHSMDILFDNYLIDIKEERKLKLEKVNKNDDE